jgi:hypothetical protein
VAVARRHASFLGAFFSFALAAGLSGAVSSTAITDAYVDFMMRFELGLEKPAPRRAHPSALMIAGAYVAGGFVPLGPYMLSCGSAAAAAAAYIIARAISAA